MSKRGKNAAKTTDVDERQADQARSEQAAVAEDELTALRREVQELRDKNLRLIAESQNAQKRAEREKQEALRFAAFEFARELLPVLDDLERTQASAREAQAGQAVADGVRIVYEHFLKVLKHRHIERIEAAGQPFDPTYHEAMLQQPSTEQPAGTVIQELSRGYTMYERVLRSSRVSVSGGPPRADQDGKKQPGAGKEK